MADGSTSKAGRAVGGLPVLALGFRPFYLLAALFAVVAVPLWLAGWTGYIQLHGYLAGFDWHSHEMVFGFASAVIAGFLLTAVRNWTGLPTASGALLAALAGLWLAGRVLALTGPSLLAVAVDLLFLPALGVVIAIPIWLSRNLRNVKVLVILSVLTLLNIIYHVAHAGLFPGEFKLVSVAAALDVITILMAVIAGRVIPAFTAGAISGARIGRDPRVEVAAFVSLVLVLILGLIGPWVDVPALVWVLVLVTAAAAHGLRLALWRPQQTRRNPLLWMLPVAYAWIPVTLLLRALAEVSLVPPAAATHALTIGAMSSLMVAMMTRSALGHTGRPLNAGPVELTAFLLLQAAAVVRISTGPLFPEYYLGGMLVAGALWFSAFAAFLFRYWPVLTRVRIDGRPG